MIATFNRILPDLRHKISRIWHILQRELKLKQILISSPVLAFERNKNFRDFFEGNKLYNDEKLTHAKTFDKWKCYPCLTRTIKLCYKQQILTSYFQSAITRKAFDIRHFVTCKSSCVIYLFECGLCTNSRYIG